MAATLPGGASAAPVSKPDKHFVTFDELYGDGGDFDGNMEDRVAKRKVQVALVMSEGAMARELCYENL